MYKIDKEKAKTILVRQGYSPTAVGRLLNNYPPLLDQFGPVIDQWMIDQVIPDYEVDGVSVKAAMENHISHFLTTIRDLSEMIDPATPKDLKESFQYLLRHQTIIR